MTAIPPYAPVLLYPNRKKDRYMLESIKKSRRPVIHDTLEEQFRELYAMRYPRTIHTGVRPRDVAEFAASLTADFPNITTYGVWAWFPWISTLMHVLPEDLHTELRTGRNRNLITREEQDRYYFSHVGVAGLSVGNSVVASLVHTGGAKFLRIADGDRVSGSNINRMRVGFDAVGIPKYAVVARETYLVNPYSDITIYKSGITKSNLEKFLVSPKPLHVVIDEMDTLYLKIQLRVLSRTYRIPVIMAADNGDGVVVDIERFDLDPTLPLMHGQVPERELLAIEPDTKRDVAAKIISRWVRPENIAGRMQESLLELGRSLYTWPQLGNAAFMAGAVLSYVARKVILKDPLVQGKVVISPDAFFVPGYAKSAAVKKRRNKTALFERAIGL